MSVFHENMLIGASGQVAAGGISRSLRFNSSDSAYLSRTPSSAGNRKTWTWAGWVKISGFGSFRGIFSAGSNNSVLLFDTNNNLQYYEYNGSAETSKLVTTQVFRDPSAWYHVVLAVDTTQATASNRNRLYVNGAEVTALSTASYPSQNSDTYINSAIQHNIGYAAFSTRYFDGYLADIHFIDGQALTPSSFTETDATTGQLVKKAYTGSFTGNSFYLTFEDNSAATAAALGKDSSGLGNNWTPNNLSVTAGAGNDSLVDVPTNGAQTDTGVGGEVRGNYCTWNAVAGSGALANGNLDFSSSGNPHKRIGTIGVVSGKWYFEAVCTTQASSFQSIGVGKGTFISDSGGVGGVSSSWGVLCETGVGNGYLYHNSSNAAGDIGTINVNDVMMFALDVDAGKFWVGLNGTWYNSGSPSGGTNATWTGVTGELFPVISSGSGGAMFANFGQRPFAYTAPSGFKALCDTNLPAPTIAKPSTVMDVKLYTGNGSTQTISGLGFSPDLVWIKNRSAGGNGHFITDTPRFPAFLSSDATAAEQTQTGFHISALNSDGFSLQGNSGRTNTSGDAFAAWTWDAGSSTVTNTQGSITSSCRTNQSSGFSIVSWTSNAANAIETMGHGLGVAPELIIVKNRDTSTGDQWPVYHKAFTSVNNYLMLSSTNAVATAGQSQWSTSSTAFGLRQSAWSTANTQKMIAYCFAPVAGYSSFGAWTNNGSTDGVFIYTGMRPRFILLKNTDNVEQWFIFDSARRTYNVQYPDPTELRPNSSAAEGSYSLAVTIDFLSNGFKIRGNTTSEISFGTRSYIYAAFAESPFQYARAR